MRIGICTSIDNIEIAQKIGFDYIEPSVVSIALMDDIKYQEVLKKVNEAEIRCEAFNVLFPGDIRLTGPNINFDGIREYLAGALERVARLGAKVVVFGSGGARRVPEDWNYENGWNDLINMARLVGEVASQHNITIAMEPLNKRETNIINSVYEGIKFVNDVDHPSIKLLADFYHMRIEDEPMEILGETTPEILAHTHIANGNGRYFPLNLDEDIYDDFFRVLKSIGYKGRVSIEGSTDQIEMDGSIALELLRGLSI